jgi:hypothetical protein
MELKVKYLWKKIIKWFKNNPEKYYLGGKNKK